MSSANLNWFDQQRLDRLYVRVRAGQPLDYALNAERCAAWFHKSLSKIERARVVALSMELEQSRSQLTKVSK